MQRSNGASRQTPPGGGVRQTPGRRWGVILAGGDGTRLLPLTRRIAGDDRPKQFCPIMGGQTLLDQTRSRVGRVVAPGHTWVIVTQSHERFYGRLVESDISSVLVQPHNQGTAPAIAYSLLRLRELDQHASVAFFPSDHHFADEDMFAACVDVAFAAAECPAEPVVLLGIVPDVPEVAYGWIEPGARMAAGAGPVFRVARFWEKPPLAVASALMERGCLWNSFVMVGRVGSFLKLIARSLPNLCESFESIRSTFYTPLEAPALLELYSGIRSSSFSVDVLAERPKGLAVLSGGDLGWSDLGEPERVLSVLQRKGATADWTHPCAVEYDAAG
jgi:mannose-1-phosphate guanylyltransferase